ncbi:MAG: exopolyphosphatase [Lachnospiraceae bacterium]|nr:exopolyphosphatase [Lachnospiraceae bacterium]
MAVKTFAALDVGSYELTMKIFEISSKSGIQEIDCIRHRIALGLDSYDTGKISGEKLDELCTVLEEFSGIMKAYKVDDYKAYGTSAIRETENTMIMLDQIKNRTGIRVDVISNSEQRFLDYKALATQGKEFDKHIAGNTAILDIGGGSIQISLFENDTLVATQHMRLGVMRLRERLETLSPRTIQYEMLIEEMVNSQFSLFKKLYLKDRDIKNLILIDDYIAPVMQKKAICKEPGKMDADTFMELTDQILHKNRADISRFLEISEENASLLFHSAVLTKQILEELGISHIWAPCVTLSDGIAYEYAQQKKLLANVHDFEKDILASTATISKRYMCSRKRNEFVESMAVSIFDAMKKVHGLGKRERLLLQIASQLNDCGKYISQIDVGECSFRIIMATEIIGISHGEREIIAYVAKYNRDDFEYYETLSKNTTLSREAYLVIAKLTAILRVANGLDRSHKQKFKDISVTLKDHNLVINVDTTEDITLETGLLTARAKFFEEVYSLRPVIKQKRHRQER